MNTNSAQAMPAPLRAVAYARFSSEMQRSESIDAQLRAISKYADDNNYHVVSNYIDIAKSGKNDDRPEFQRMVADARNQLFDIVIVHKLDRFARNRYDSVRYRHELKKNDIQIMSVLENYDSETPEGVLIESLYEGMNEYYIRNLSREIMKGLRENAYQGKFTGGTPPLGYSVNRDLEYEINEEEARIVRLIFELRAQKMGYGKIVDKLNTLGHRTRAGQAFGKNSIFGILKNPKYYGVYEFNVTPSRSVEGARNSHARKPENEIVRIEDAVPPIISKELYDYVQEIRRKTPRRPGAYQAKEVYLLSGKIYCGNCGYLYVGHRKFNSSGKKYVHYECNNRQRKHVCESPVLTRDEIEAYVLDKISELVFDEEIIPELCEAYDQYLQELSSESYTRLKNQEKRHRQNTREISNLVSLMTKTGAESLIEKLEILEQEKNELEYQINATKEEMNSEHIDESDIRDAFSLARHYFSQGELSQTKKLIDLFVDKILVFDDHVELRIKIKPDTPIPLPTGKIEKPGSISTQNLCRCVGAEGAQKNYRTRGNQLSNILRKHYSRISR